MSDPLLLTTTKKKSLKEHPFNLTAHMSPLLRNIQYHRAVYTYCRDYIEWNVIGNKEFTVFNSQSLVEVGGLLADNTDDKPIINKAFRGKILGLKVNGNKILDLAMANSTYVSDKL